MYNILLTNVGRRGTLIKYFKHSLNNSCKIIATDNWAVSPAVFFADDYYITPKPMSDDYIEKVLEICVKEEINAITTLIDPEIMILSKNRDKFQQLGVLLLCPSVQTAKLCFDKFLMYKYLCEKGIRTVLTFDNIKSFDEAYEKGVIGFPVFIKPKSGSGSVGAQKVNTREELNILMEDHLYEYIIQEYMDCEDFDADVYVDAISNKPVAIFSKRKIETRIGGASKTISFKDEKLFDFVKEILNHFEFYGPIDMDFFYRNGEYYLSEINPRFGGAYLNAYGAGVDFPKMIANNIDGHINDDLIGNYDEGVLMLMYDDVVITTVEKLKGDYRD
ncbi:MAG: ATP-grasp domain-containing protein [Bacilli bacterium]